MTHGPRLHLARFAWLAGVAGAVAAAGCDPVGAPPADPPELFLTGSPDIVISQLYGGGGNSGAQFTHDFVELFNHSASAVAVDGWTVQYASASGNSWAAANLSGTIPVGGYYLVQLAAGSGTSAALPTPDATGTMNMSGTSGTVALVSNRTLLSCGGSVACLPNAAVHDFVGYGTAAQFEGSDDAPTASNSTAEFRAAGGCTDTNDNSADFTTAAPTPRNSAHAHTTCAGGGGGGGTPDAGVPDAGGGGATPDAGGGGATPDAGGGGATPDAGGGGTGDGTPTRQTCTSSFGSAMTATFGRLDGFLVAIVNPNTTSSCRGDDNHIHLQVKVNGGIEDIAVNIASTTGNPDVSELTLNTALRGGAWSEGWHPGQTLDFANTLGVHSTSFVEETPTQLTSQIDSMLTSANHVSIFTTGFDATGGHLIHREGSSHDGAIVINPLSATPTWILLRFSDQSF